jgi:hypothetical protein
MEFKTEAQEASFQKMATWLTQLYGEQAVPRTDDFPGWTVDIGRRPVSIDVQAMGDNWACLDFYAWPLPKDVRLPQAAYRGMLETNGRYRVGSLNLQTSGAALWEHFVVDTGELTKELVGAMVRWMGADAADVGEELMRKFPPA